MIEDFSDIKLCEISVGGLIKKTLQTLLKNKTPDLNNIVVQLDDANIIFSYRVTQILRNLYNAVNSIKEPNTLFKPKNSGCTNSLQCANINRLLQTKLKLDLAFKDPLKYYLDVIFEIETIKSDKNNLCNGCLKNISKTLSLLKNKLEKTFIVSEYLKLPDEIKTKPLELIYERLLPLQITPRKSKSSSLGEFEDKKIIESYGIGPYLINIYAPPEASIEFLYHPTTIWPESELAPLLDGFKKYVGDLKYFSSKTEDYYQLDQLIGIRKKQVESFIRSNISKSYIKDPNLLIEYLSYQMTALSELMPYLIDDRIEEVFIDNPYSKIYLDHRKYGRCITNHVLSKDGFDRIVTYLRAISGLRLDSQNPSFKTDLVSASFHIRISIDISPLAADEFHVDIRKLKKKYFSIIELIENGSITSEAAAYLYFCLIRKRNILVLGRPGDGKTTIINALDGITPPFWRKITVEDVTESVPQTGLKHQTRFHVDPLESRSPRHKKSTEITRLLHRSPDYLLISEIQTAEDSKAFFHALSAGLSGLFTCHGNSVEDLLLRWNIHHKIPAVSFHQLDLLVNTKKFDLDGKFTRRVVRISEISNIPSNLFDESENNPQIIDVFKWSATDKKIISSTDLYDTPVIRKIREYEVLDRDQFYSELNSYRTILEFLLSSKQYSYQNICIFFSKLFSFLCKGTSQGGRVDWDEIILWSKRIIEEGEDVI